MEEREFEEERMKVGLRCVTRENVLLPVVSYDWHFYCLSIEDWEFNVSM